MGKKITWIEPNRPDIPSEWPIIINGDAGTAYEDMGEYTAELQRIRDEYQTETEEPEENEL